MTEEWSAVCVAVRERERFAYCNSTLSATSTTPFLLLHNEK